MPRRGCRGLLIELREVTGSAAQWERFATEIATLKTAGKQVAIFAESLSGAAYAAACGADLLALPPSGGLELLGVSAELTSAGPLLKKLGIRPAFARRESFKTAPELFTEAEASPAQRETAEALLDQAFAALVESLGRRGLSAGRPAARAAIDRGLYTGRTAKARRADRRAGLSRPAAGPHAGALSARERASQRHRQAEEWPTAAGAPSRGAWPGFGDRPGFPRGGGPGAGLAGSVRTSRPPRKSPRVVPLAASAGPGSPLGFADRTVELERAKPRVAAPQRPAKPPGRR